MLLHLQSLLACIVLRGLNFLSSEKSREKFYTELKENAELQQSYI